MLSIFRFDSRFDRKRKRHNGCKGSTVEVSINLDGASEVGSMDIVLNYDADAGTTSYLTLGEVLVHNLDLGEIIPNTVNGTFEVT